LRLRNDIHRVFDNAADRRKLQVSRLRRRYVTGFTGGITSSREEEDAAKRVAHRLAETGFQRLEVEVALGGSRYCFCNRILSGFWKLRMLILLKRFREVIWVVKNKFASGQGAGKPLEGFGILREKGLAFRMNANHIHFGAFS
jgi:hypothetical protein